MSRFYNANLQGTYASCPLPVIRSPNDVIPVPPHILQADQYRRRQDLRRSEHCPWSHSRFRPLRQWTPPVPALSVPFYGFDPKKPVSRTSRKRRKVQPDATASAKQKTDDVAPKTNGRKRKLKLNAEGKVFRSAKVRMWPTSVQRRELVRCFDVCRYAYNWALECVQTEWETAATQGPAPGACGVNHQKLRNKFRALKVMQGLPYANTPEKTVNSDTVSHSIKQLTDAFASNFAKRKKDPTHTFHVDFLAKSKKKTPTEVIVIEKRGAHYSSFLNRFEPCVCNDKRSGRAGCMAFFGNNLKGVGGIRMQDSERIISCMLAEGNNLQENCKIQWDKRTGAFYFIYLYTVQKPADPDPDFTHKRIVATDPGCAPFQEWYSPTSGEYGALLDDGWKEIKSRCHSIDKLQSRLAYRQSTPMHMLLTRRRRECMTLPQMKRAHRGTTRRLRRKLAKERRRLHGFVESAHYDAANFLLDEHDIVIIPVLQVSELAKKKDRNRIFGSKMARAMYTWSHYLFRQRLISASARYAGRHVYETTEPGTSKTCTHCGTWKASLRLGDKTYECERCNISVDRQLAGARNNFLAAYGMASGMLWDNVTQ